MGDGSLREGANGEPKVQNPNARRHNVKVVSDRPKHHLLAANQAARWWGSVVRCGREWRGREWCGRGRERERSEKRGRSVGVRLGHRGCCIGRQADVSGTGAGGVQKGSVARTAWDSTPLARQPRQWHNFYGGGRMGGTGKREGEKECEMWARHLSRNCRRVVTHPPPDPTVSLTEGKQTCKRAPTLCSEPNPDRNNRFLFLLLSRTHTLAHTRSLTSREAAGTGLQTRIEHDTLDHKHQSASDKHGRGVDHITRHAGGEREGESEREKERERRVLIPICVGLGS